MVDNAPGSIDVFVSYAHEDRHTAEAVARQLRAKGWSVWWDPSIRTGTRFSQVIEDALQTARCVVVLWSSHSIGSDWVQDEAQVGKDRDILFPVRIDSISPPLGFRRIQTADLLGWTGEEGAESFVRLHEHLVEMLGDPLVPGIDIERILSDGGRNPWQRLAMPPVDPSEVPWPYWMVRYVVADTMQAMSDLIWSVGGSTPYGGVSAEEAAAVYELVENFRGPGRAPERFYARVERSALRQPAAWRALEAFRMFDRVASSPDDFSLEDLRVGGVDTVETTEEPLRSYFQLLDAQLRYRDGDYSGAKELTLKAVDVLRAFAARDPVYVHRLTQALTNAVSFCAMDGDLERARVYAGLLKELNAEAVQGDAARQLLEKPRFAGTHRELFETGAGYLRAHQPVMALEWLLEAERRVIEANETEKLADLRLLIAESYRRVKNVNGAVRTYRRAIEASQRADKQLLMNQACHGLAGVLIGHRDIEAALPYVRAAVYMATESGDEREVESALELLDAALAMEPQRAGDFREILTAAAKEIAEKATEGSAVSALLTGALRRLEKSEPAGEASMNAGG